MNLSDDDLEKIAITFARVMQQARSVSDSEHYEDHMWLKARRQKEIARAKFYSDLSLSLARWGLIGAVGLLITIIYGAFKAWVKHAAV